MTHFPKFKRYLKKRVNLEKLDKLIDTPDSCWSYEDSISTYKCWFTSLLGCQVEHPPMIGLDISVDEGGRILYVGAHVHLFVFNPPFVGYQQCGTPPVGKDLQHIREVLESVLEV